jgi:hypothetical protein
MSNTNLAAALNDLALSCNREAALAAFARNATFRSAVREHGLADAKGRALGGRFEVEQRKDGFHVFIGGARDGRPFGPTNDPSRTAYATLDEALVAAEQRLDAQAARHRRKAAAK